MNVLCIFSGQGNTAENLLSFFQNDKEISNYIEQLSQLMKINFNQPGLINQPNYSQFIISAYQLSLFHTIQAMFNTHTLTLAGYSLGEVSAFLASTNASPKKINEVITCRTQLMTSLLNETNLIAYDLISIYGAFDFNELQKKCSEYECYIAIINSAQRVVVGGQVPSLNKLINALTSTSLKIRFLSVHLPSHTPLYANKQGLFKQALLALCLSPLKYPLISPLKLCKIYASEEEIEFLDKELYSTLHWDKVCELIKEYQYELIVDLGPENTMRHLLNLGEHSDKLIAAADYKSSIGFKIALLERLGL